MAPAGDGGAPRSRAKAALADERSVAARGRGFAHLRPRVTQVIRENPEIFRGKKAGLIISGGNVDFRKLPF
jgi:hypothetical protein